MRKMSIYYGN